MARSHGLTVVHPANAIAPSTTARLCIIFFMVYLFACSFLATVQFPEYIGARFFWHETRCA
jgi:hypothetical protein